MEVTAAGSRETEDRLRGSETQTIPDGNAYCNPSRIQIEPNPAKPSQGRAKKIKEKSFDFLVRIEPFQRVMLTPWAKNSFASSSSPLLLARAVPDEPVPSITLASPQSRASRPLREIKAD
jgi:hypothetical protein